MRVRDVMDSSFASIGPDDTLREAARRMAQNGHSALPVLDGEGRLLGIIAELDVLKMLLPDYLEGLGDLSFLPADLPAGPHGFDEVACLSVSRAMRSEGVQTVEEDEPVMEAIRLLVQGRLHQVVVVRAGRVVGMVRHADLVSAVVQPRAEDCSAS